MEAGLGKRREVEEEGRRVVTRWEGSLRSKGSDADELARSEERKAVVKLEALLKARQTESSIFPRVITLEATCICGRREGRGEEGREGIGNDCPPCSQEGREEAPKIMKVLRSFFCFLLKILLGKVLIFSE